MRWWRVQVGLSWCEFVMEKRACPWVLYFPSYPVLCVLVTTVWIVLLSHILTLHERWWHIAPSSLQLFCGATLQPFLKLTFVLYSFLHSVKVISFLFLSFFLMKGLEKTLCIFYLEDCEVPIQSCSLFLSVQWLPSHGSKDRLHVQCLTAHEVALKSHRNYLRPVWASGVLSWVTDSSAGICKATTITHLSGGADCSLICLSNAVKFWVNGKGNNTFPMSSKTAWGQELEGQFPLPGCSWAGSSLSRQFCTQCYHSIVYIHIPLAVLASQLPWQLPHLASQRLDWSTGGVLI